MKSLLLLTASGPLLILTSHESSHDPKLREVLRGKGIGKFVAFEVPLSLARERYGEHFHAVESNLHETDDLRVLDFDGQSSSSVLMSWGRRSRWNRHDPVLSCGRAGVVG